MSDQKSINSLFDFSDLRKKSDQNQIFNKFINQSEQSSQNEALLRAFKELRQKLKVQTREINALKDQIKIANIKCRQNQQALSATLTSNLEMKQKLSQSTSQCQQMKKKVSIMKQTVQSQANYYQEVQFTKQALLQMKTHTDELQKQRNKIMEISLAEKMDLEQEINRLKSKIQSDNKFVEELQGNLNKARQTTIKQDNQIKKLTINFEQEVFNKNWSKDNFQTQHLLNTIKQLQREVNVLKAKTRKDKEKKAVLEDRIIELEEVSGFHNVKAETFEGQIDMISKKYSKLDKKYKQLKTKLEKTNGEKLNMEQNLNKLVYESEGLTSKLKALNIVQVNNAIQEYQNKVSFISSKYQQIEVELNNLHKPKEDVVSKSSDSTKNQFYSFQPNNYMEQTRAVLCDYNKNATVRQGKPKGNMYGSNMTFGDRQNEQSQTQLIQNRIKRQRQQMQRKIKEKMLHRKLQASSPNQQFKLRGEYIKTFIDRQY